ncbi:membrane-spanning 4-domains subfamily A member 4A [Xyrauchen texanus]|uniref:membrane-spanning 4-domains subfamily A member 4A n=1 Tax=Xyrauchen texanus TaxID=154827 RepID=UPI002242ADF2|nr:membrane-spanning 4-domains subfamily A member 4A [Xyrauchen texanus]
MASSMTTTANGVTVVTHIIPIEEKTLDLEASFVDPEKPSLPPTTRMFLKGKPLSLGLVQVFTGLVIMALCSITLVINTLPAEIIFALGLPFVISGSVAIVAHSRSNLTLIKATLSMSVICAVVAVGGICYFSWMLSIRPEEDPSCNGESYWSCQYMRWRFINLMDGVKGILLSLSFLELCVCITLSVISGRAIRLVSKQDKTDGDPYNSKSSLLKDGVDCASKP